MFANTWHDGWLGSGFVGKGTSRRTPCKPWLWAVLHVQYLHFHCVLCWSPLALAQFICMEYKVAQELSQGVSWVERGA